MSQSHLGVVLSPSRAGRWDWKPGLNTPAAIRLLGRDLGTNEEICHWFCHLLCDHGAQQGIPGATNQMWVLFSPCDPKPGLPAGLNRAGKQQLDDQKVKGKKNYLRLDDSVKSPDVKGMLHMGVPQDCTGPLLFQKGKNESLK